MKKIEFALASISLALIAIVAGCNTEPKTADENGSTTPVAGPGEHVHADGTIHKDHSVAGHAHAPGPHDGTIVDWGGGKFHVEFTVDHDNKEATVYILGKDEKTPTPIDASEITLTIKEPSLTTMLKAVPQDGDPEGTSSRFVGTDEGLATVREYEGTLSGVVDAVPYSGNFRERKHDH